MTIRVFFRCDQISEQGYVDVEAGSINAAQDKADDYFAFHDLTNVHVDAGVPQD